MANTLFSHADPSQQAEVVDKFNRVVCLMPAGEILRQNLLHRQVGMFLRTHSGKILLLQNSSEYFDLPSVAIPPAGMAAKDFCGNLAEEKWGLKDINARRIGFLPPSPQTSNSFITLFECILSPGFAREIARNNGLLVDSMELVSLACRDGLLSPMLIAIIQKFYRNKTL